MSEKTIFLDMDGTVARFYERRASCLEEMYDKDFFKFLNPYMSMLYAVKALVAKGHNIYICSACVTEHCKDEKKEWLKALLPEIPENHYILLEVGQNKADIVKKVLDTDDLSEAYLVDDYSRNLHEWVKEGGQAIKFMNELNGTGGTWSGPKIHYDDSPADIVKGIEDAMNMKDILKTKKTKRI